MEKKWAVTAEYLATLKLYPYNSGYKAVWARGYPTNPNPNYDPINPNPNPNPKPRVHSLLAGV